MGMPVVVSTNGYGLPVTVASTGFGMPCTLATNGLGVPVVQATNGLGLPVTGITFGPQPPAAPTLVLTSANTDTTPDFTLSGDLVVGDTVRFQYSTSAGFGSPSELTNTIDAAEDTANLITFTTGALALGTWYFRARIERPVLGSSNWSNTVTDTIIAPSYTGPGDVVGSAMAFWGVRAYSAATIGANAIRIIRFSDKVEQNFVTLSTGELDYAGIVTFLGGSAGRVRTLFDQTGNGRHLTNALDSTAQPTRFPIFTATGPNSKGQLNFVAANSHTLQFSGAGSQAQPTTMMAAASRTTAGTDQSLVLAGSSEQQVGYSSTAHTAKMYAGGSVTATASDGAFHCLQAIFNGASSNLRVDATDTIGNASTSGIGAGTFEVGTAGGGQAFGGFLLELGVWPGAFTGTQLTNMDANVSAYYGI